jgi:hypothetical protein
MTTRALASATVAALLAVPAFVASVTTVAAQAPAARPAAAAAAASNWTPPRTPWGDPDISGNFSNKYEIGTPFERPAEFAGRTIDSFTPAEITAIAKARQERNLLNYPHQGDADNPAGNLGGPNTWGDRFEISKGTRPWFVIDPPDGKIPDLTPEARKRQAAGRAEAAARAKNYVPGPLASWNQWRDQQNVSLYDRCITRGLPGSMMPASYGNSYRITQGPGYVAITYEMVHETRVIPIDTRPQLDPAIRQYMGAGRGHWEGDTLVVEAANFRNPYRGSTANVKLTERFTRIAPNVVDWKTTVEDPQTWTRPWTFAVPLTENDAEAVVEYACHEGNYSMPLRLKAGRAAEVAAEEAAKKGLTVGPREQFLDEDEERQEKERLERERERQR